MTETTVTKEYKDRLFSFIFGKEKNKEWILELYNEHAYSEGGFIAPMALASWEADKLPSACIGCGACAAVCPQQIDIPGTMTKFSEMLAKEEE